MKAPNTQSLAEQIQLIKRAGETSQAHALVLTLALLCGISVYVAVTQTGEIIRGFAQLAAFITGLLALIVVFTKPRISRAARAIREGRRVFGTIDLVVDSSDPDHTRYRGFFQSKDKSWQLRFTNPNGWQPVSGTFNCEAILLPDDSIPLVVQLPDGLLLTTKS